jgi:integrase
LSRRRVKIDRKKGKKFRYETEHEWLARLGQKKAEELNQWRKDHRFFPNQLRHNAATHRRRVFGLETAALILGHASAEITDAVYAERDEQKIREAIRRVG